MKATSTAESGTNLEPSSKSISSCWRFFFSPCAEFEPMSMYGDLDKVIKKCAI